MTLKPSSELLTPLRECMESYGVGDANAEWPNNILSTQTVVYSNGTIGRSSDEPALIIDEDEILLCKRLAAEAKELIGDLEVGMGSESGDSFFPFFVCSNGEHDANQVVNADFIRNRFGGTIFPAATISVEPLCESGVWWDEVSLDAEDDPEILNDWRKLISWFKSQSEMADPVFVRIGDREALWEAEEGRLPEGTEMTGGVLPRLAVARTKQNSLVGLFGYSVQT